ncbi:MAG: Nif3-like dinuclear metal center hexameric protein [Lachnospiraceae bacterium]|nr:Nif3-like dinuclear metal center hexameric protein [Lachnospiraceae bacterium]
MTCQQIIELLEQHSPTEYAESWDNVGLLAGRREKEVHKVMAALDATDAVIRQAVKAGADMLLTHHPLLFLAKKSVTTDDMEGLRLIRLIQNDISCYAMHTNFDVCGMAEMTEQKLGLKGAEILEVTRCLENGTQIGLGRIGELPSEMTLEELAEYVKQQFDLDHVRISGDRKAVIRRAAVCGGSGKSVVDSALKAGADVLISGDFGHHTVLDAQAEGLCMIDAGHFGTEKMFVPYIVQYLTEKCTDVEIVAANERSPFTVI